MKGSPVFSVLPKTLALFPQAGQVHLSLQCHLEGASVGDLQIKPQTWTQTCYTVMLQSRFFTSPNTCECCFCGQTTTSCLLSNCYKVPCRATRKKTSPQGNSEKVSCRAASARYWLILSGCFLFTHLHLSGIQGGTLLNLILLLC